MDLDALAASCESLRRNPVTHLGLADKELFHSNFIAWLLEAHPEAGRTVFDGLLEPDDTQQAQTVQREWRHLDLVVAVRGYRQLVIENKTFSPPDLQQLAAYAQDKAVQRLSATFLFLSLGDPGWTMGEHRTPEGAIWRWRGYDWLCERLQEVEGRLGEGFERELVARYRQMLTDLVDISEAYTAPAEDELLTPGREELERLKDSRLADGILKLRTRKIAQQARADAARVLGDRFLRANAGFSNSSPFIEMFARAGRQAEVGWQLQRSQFRLAVVFTPKSMLGAAAKSRRSTAAKEMSDRRGWFDFGPLERLLDGRCTPLLRARPDANGFNHFNPSFVYQYRVVADLTVGELLQLNEEYAELARQAT